MKQKILALSSLILLTLSILTPQIWAQGNNTRPGQVISEKTAPAMVSSGTPSPEMQAQSEKGVPDMFKVKFECSNGDFVVEFHKDWSPRGAERVYELVKCGFYNDARFFRVIKGFMAQFGMAGDPALHAEWSSKSIKDDPVIKSNTRGMVTFAKTGLPDSRSTQLFINYGNNVNLDSMGFAPVGKVVEGMEVVDALYGEYGEGAPRGRGPSQEFIKQKGNAYLNEKYPKLDFIKKATIIE